MSARSSGGSRGPRSRATTDVDGARRADRHARVVRGARELHVRPAGLAYQADLTRVFTFMMARDASQRVYPNIGITEPHHAMSHHGNNPEKLAGPGQAQHLPRDAVREVPARSCKSTPDGDGSLLDHSLILYGSGMSESEHALPPRRADAARGRSRAAVKGNRHIQAPKETPLAQPHGDDRRASSTARSTSSASARATAIWRCA